MLTEAEKIKKLEDLLEGKREPVINPDWFNTVMYTGNGKNKGPVCNLGDTPSFVIIKKTKGDWSTYS